jgi:hypothetical protein
MNEASRLAAWLEANAKHMDYEEEAIQMRKAARQLRRLEEEVKANLEALQSAHEMLAEMRKVLEGVSKQEATGDRKRFSLSMLWR